MLKQRHDQRIFSHPNGRDINHVNRNLRFFKRFVFIVYFIIRFDVIGVRSTYVNSVVYVLLCFRRQLYSVPEKTQQLSGTLVT